jgi:PGF-CTERM protein
MARQVESNVIADRATVSVDQIDPGRTVTPTAVLEVPTDYNYYLDGILLKDDVIVGTATAGAMLDPNRPVPKNETREEVEFEAGDFDSSTPEPERDADGARPTTVGASGPGFGVAAALAALLALAAAFSRRNQ